MFAVAQRGPVWAAGRWTPARLLPLAWFYASLDNVMLTGGNSVFAWLDISGHLNYLDQGLGSARPTWTTSAWPGGRPAILFNYGKSLDRSGATISTDLAGVARPWTLLVTIAVFEFNIARTVSSWDDGVSGGNKSICMTQATNGRTRYVRQEGAGSVVAVDAATGALSPGRIHRVAYVFSGSTITTYVDGVVAISAQAIGGGVSLDITRFRQGDGPNSGPDSMVGLKTEEVIVARAISAAEVAQYQAWSVAEFGTGNVTITKSTPTFVVAGTGDDDGASSTQLVIPYPAGLQANDYLVIQIVSRVAGTVPAGIVGWDTLATDTFSGGRQQNLYGKFSDGTETGTVTVVFDANSDSTCGRMYVFRNVRPSPDTSEQSDDEVASGDGDFTGPTLVCSETNELAVWFGCADQNVVPASFGAVTGGTWGSVEQFGTNVGGNCSVFMQCATMASGGTISGGLTNIGADNDGVARFLLFKGTYQG